MKRSALLAAMLLGTTLATGAAAARPDVELRCVAYGSGPQLECTVRLRTAEIPLADARVTLGASMPSMPMAHSVKPVVAAPTGQPGEYRASLELEMTGVWAVQVDIGGPLRDRVVRTLHVEDCEGDRRCPVPAARPRR